MSIFGSIIRSRMLGMSLFLIIVFFVNSSAAPAQDGKENVQEPTVAQNEDLEPKKPKKDPPPMKFQPSINADSISDFSPPGAKKEKIEKKPKKPKKPKDDKGNNGVGNGNPDQPSLSDEDNIVVKIETKDDVFVTTDEDFALLIESNTFTNTIDLQIEYLETITPTVRAEGYEGEIPESKEVIPESAFNLPEPKELLSIALEPHDTSTGEIISEFEQPVRFAFDLKEQGIDLEEDGGSFYIAYEDPENPGVFIDIPITVHRSDGLISGETTHFSNWVGGWRPESWSLEWNPPAVSEFTGSASYNYPINVPPGRAGLQPSVALSYSSTSLNGAVRKVSQGTVAAGWSLPDISITRVGTEMLGHGYAYENKFRLVLNGAGHRLIQGGTETINGQTAIIFYAENAPSIRIENYGGLKWNDNLNHHNFWVVKTGDGVTYRLGYTNNHGYAPYNNPSVTFQKSKLGANGPIKAEATAWHVDTITDAMGNQILYQYERHERTEEIGYWCPWGGNCYLKIWNNTAQVSEILYNFPGVVTPNNPVPFDIGRLNIGSTAGSKIKFNYGYGSENRLASIDIHHGSGLPKLRHYVISAENRNVNNPSVCDRRKADGTHETRTITTRVITQIQEFTGASNSHSLPATLFTYEVKPHLTHQNQGCFSFSYLERVNNGYGGLTDFHYFGDGRTRGDSYGNCIGWQPGDNPCEERFPSVGYNYRVSNIYHYDGHKDDTSFTANGARTFYSYSGACYDQKETSPDTICKQLDTESDWGNIGGHTKVVATAYDLNNTAIHRTINEYHTDVNRFGKPFRQRSGPPDLGNSQALKSGKEDKIETTYVTTTFGSNAPFTYVREVKSYNTNVGSISGKVRYSYEVGTGSTSNQMDQSHTGKQFGQITKIEEFDSATASTPYRTTRRYHIARTNNGYWVIRQKSEGVYEGSSWTLLHANWNYFDQTSNLQSTGASSALTNGLLKRQRLVQYVGCGGVQGGTISGCTKGYQTIDKQFTHDSYGNIKTERSYTDYGYLSMNSAQNHDDNPPSQSQTTTINYDSSYNLYPVSVTNAKNQTTNFQVWGFGTALTGFQTQTGLLRRVTDPNGISTFYEYDPYGRLYEVYESASSSTPTGFGNAAKSDGDASIRYVYNDNSWAGAIHVDPAGNEPFSIETFIRPEEENGANDVSEFSLSVSFYDGFGREIQTQSPYMSVEGGSHDQVIVSSKAYDAVGNIICESVPFNLSHRTSHYGDQKCNHSSRAFTSTSIDFQDIGRSTITYPDGTKTENLTKIRQTWADGTAIDSANRFYTVASTIDPKGNAKTMATNNRGQLTHVVEHEELPAGGSYRPIYAITEYEYDLQENLTKVTDALGNETNLGFDKFGRKTSMEDPNMGEWFYAYDASSNLIQQKDERNNRLCFWYDDLNRATTKATYTSDCPNSAPPNTSGNWLATWAYDGATDGIGQVSQINWKGPGGANHNKDEFTFDNRGHLSSQTRTIDNQSFTMGYSNYDGLNRATTMTYPDGEIVTTTFDRNGVNVLKAGTTTLIGGVDHTAQGQIKFINRGGGSHAHDTTFTYYGKNENFRLHKIQHGSWGESGSNPNDYTFTYDDVGNISSIDNSASSEAIINFTYDFLYRLTDATGAYNRYIRYDEVGNITRKGTTSSSYKTYGYNPNQPHAVTSVGSYTFGYDPNGNMTSRTDGTGIYIQTFDEENRLEQVKKNNSNSQITKFYYDPSGQRTMTVDPDGTTTYFPFSDYEEIHSEVAVPTATPTSTSIPPTNTPIPTATGVPPTNTPVPTSTGVPPTNTPIPTATNVPPTATASPTAANPGDELIYTNSFQNGWYDDGDNRTTIQEPAPDPVNSGNNTIKATVNSAWGHFNLEPQNGAFTIPSGTQLSFKLYAVSTTNLQVKIREGSTYTNIVLNSSNSGSAPVLNQWTTHTIDFDQFNFGNHTINRIAWQGSNSSSSTPTYYLDDIKIIGAGSNNPTPTPVNTLVPTNTPVGPTPTNVPSGSLEQEAEAASRHGIMTLGNDSAASGNQYVGTSSSDPQGYTFNSANRVDFTFNINQPGTYRIDATIKTPTGSANSFFVEVDQQSSSRYTWHAGIYTAWTLDAVDSNVTLSAGTRTISFYHRESWAQIDKIELVLVSPIGGTATPTATSSSPTSTPVPTSTPAGPTPTSVPSSSLEQEAEAASRHGLMVLGNDAGASGGQFVGTTAGNPSSTAFNSANRVDFAFNIAQAGTYQIKATIKTINGSQNSFYIEIDQQSSSRYTWHAGTYSTFTAATVSSTFVIGSGSRTVSFYTREAGAKLDKIELILVSSSSAPASQSLAVERLIPQDNSKAGGPVLADNHPDFIGPLEAPQVAQQATNVEVVVRKTYSIDLQLIAQSSYTRIASTSSQANSQRTNAVSQATGVETLHIYTDHLGSGNTTVDVNTGTRKDTRYAPFGEERYSTGAAQEIGQGFTGHHENPSLGLTYMNARFYVPGAGRFASADTIIPDATNPQAWNRYSYVYNNPVNHTDPSGHCIRQDCPRWVKAIGNFIGGAVAEATVALNMGLNPVVNEKLDMKPSEPAARTAGRIVGGATMSTVGAVEIGTGSTMVTGGAIACLTGAGCLAGAPTMAAGSALVVHGSGMALSGANGTAEAIIELYTQATESAGSTNSIKRVYKPTQKHGTGGHGTYMDLDDKTAQKVLNDGIENGKQVYGYNDGKVYAYQPDNQGTYHGYPIRGNEAPNSVLREWRDNGTINNTEYGKLRKGK